MRPYNLAVNTKHLYWTTTFVPSPDHGKVMRVPLSGGAPEVLATGTDDHPNPHSIVIDGASVYWTDFVSTTGAIIKMPLDGGTPIVLAANQDNPHGLAADATSIYWTTFLAPDANGPGGQIRSTAKDGTGPAPVIDIARGQTLPNNLAVDDTFVYWTNFAPKDRGGAVVKARRDGSSVDAPIVVASMQDFPYGIAVDRLNIYWTNSMSGEVMRKPLDGAAPAAAIASGQDNPFVLSIDETNVYWANYTIDLPGFVGNDVPGFVGAIRRAPLAGGPWTELSPATSYDVIIDGTNAYWTSFEDGADGGVSIAGGSIFEMALP